MTLPERREWFEDQKKIYKRRNEIRDVLKVLGTLAVFCLMYIACVAAMGCAGVL